MTDRKRDKPPVWAAPMPTLVGVETAAIVLIGDEILSGKVRDLNGQKMLQRLRLLGVQVTEMHIVSDDEERIVETLAAVRTRNDLVFTSGGIGPTHDDRTLSSLARTFGVELYQHSGLVEGIKAKFGVGDDNAWLKMAWIPQGAEVVFADGLHWPIYRHENVFVLPGVPAVFNAQFEAISEAISAAPIFHDAIYVSCGEGEVAPALNRLLDAHPRVAFGSYPKWKDPEYRVRITVEGRSSDDVSSATDALRAHLADDIVRVERHQPVSSTES